MLLRKLCVTHSWRHRWHHQLKSISNFVTAITRLVFIVQRKNICCHNIWLTGFWHLSVGFGLKDRQRLRIEPVFGNFKIRAIDIIASFGLQIWKLNGKLWNESILQGWRHQRRHNVTLNISPYIHLWEIVAPNASFKLRISQGMLLRSSYFLLMHDKEHIKIDFSSSQIKGQGIIYKATVTHRHDSFGVLWWLCYHGNDNAVSLSVSKLSRDGVWRPFWNVIKLKGSVNVAAEY